MNLSYCGYCSARGLRAGLIVCSCNGCRRSLAIARSAVRDIPGKSFGAALRPYDGTETTDDCS